MLVWLAVLSPVQAAGPVPQSTPSPVVAPVPVARMIDWTALPSLPYRRTPRMTSRMMAFVAAEMRRGACPPPAPADGRMQLRADVAVLIGNDGVVRATIPRAIDCPTVEQYAAGLVVSFTRSNLVSRLAHAGNWYRATILFEWPQ